MMEHEVDVVKAGTVARLVGEIDKAKRKNYIEYLKGQRFMCERILQMQIEPWIRTKMRMEIARIDILIKENSHE